MNAAQRIAVNAMQEAIEERWGHLQDSRNVGKAREHLDEIELLEAEIEKYADRAAQPKPKPKPTDFGLLRAWLESNREIDADIAMPPKVRREAIEFEKLLHNFKSSQQFIDWLRRLVSGNPLADIMDPHIREQMLQLLDMYRPKPAVDFQPLIDWLTKHQDTAGHSLITGDAYHAPRTYLASKPEGLEDLTPPDDRLLP